MVSDPGGCDGDIAQLIDGWFRDNGAIGQEKSSVDSEPRIVEIEDQHRGGGLHALLSRNDLEKGAERTRRGFGGTGDDRIDLIGGEHHRCVIIWIFDRRSRFLAADAFVATEVFKTLNKIVEVVCPFWFDQADTFEADVESGGRFLDLGTITDENRHAHPARGELARSLDDPRIGAFRKDDPLWVPLEFFDQFLDECHEL